MKYLLVKFANAAGYWDTSGYCHWSKDEYFNEQEFDLDDEQGVINSIGKFRSEYENGEVSLYKIEDIKYSSNEYDRLHAIITCGKIRGDELKKEEKEKKRQIEIKENERQKKAQEERELAQLKKLQEKYKNI